MKDVMERRCTTRERARSRSTPSTPPARVLVFPKRVALRPEPAAPAASQGQLERLFHGDRCALESLSPAALAEVTAFGHLLYEQGRLAEARVVFEGLVAMDPAEPFPYTVLGAIFLTQSDLHRALALFEAALELDADDVAALVYRGEIRLKLGQPARGRCDLERALALDPDGPWSPFSTRARSALRQARGPGAAR